MNIYIYIYIYTWYSLLKDWSSLKKLAWVGFELWISDHGIPFRRSNWLSYQAKSSTSTQSQPCTATQISSFFSVRFHFSCCLRQSPRLFNRNSLEVITSVQRNELIHMVFTTEELLEVAIESWPEWDFNPQPLNSVQTL